MARSRRAVGQVAATASYQLPSRMFCYLESDVVKVGRGWVVTALLVGMPWVVAHANSVDCQKPSTKIDRLVCGSQPLLNLDTKYAQAYTTARDSVEDRDQFMKLAASDLQWRAANCSDSICVEEWYENVTPRYLAFAANAKMTKTRPSADEIPSKQSDRTPQVQAVNVAAAYEANGLAADERFRGKRSSIAGVVIEVRRDVGDDPYVALLGGYRYGAIKLVFSSNQEPELSKLKKWQNFAASCVGLGLHYDVPVFDCREQSATASKVAARPRAQMEGMLNEADRLNGECRGGLPANPRTSEACSDRDLLMTQIERAGWCWGHAGEAGYQRKWVECRPGD
ncbi:hypothetical protein LMG26845_00491 [Achromobacter insuavis]|uniref:Lysozyme inhibitor LprI N-terminal domain-containing protein n=2 Tax=Achromobacter insuavis TaxID=1287735 RepID=A0A6J4ZKC9_9BURK|nr:hypothetical protein LMG26845_00491 [Achromobacter insuavis]